MLKSIPLLALAFYLTACAVTANPTPVIIVVTATPNANPSTPVTVVSFGKPTPTASRTLVAALETPGAVGTAEPNLKPTDVKYVRALQDINIRKGPGTNFDIVGGVYKGQTAEVTGYQSADGQWWRVVCPVENVPACWVSADTQLTEPTDKPNTSPTESAGVTVETYVRQLAAALQAKKYDDLRGMMTDPFTFGLWLSEGSEFSPTEATKRLQDQWLGPANNVVIDLADKTDQTKLLKGTNPLTMWDPKVTIAKTVYVQGLGADGKAEALLVISQNADKTFSWYGMLYAQTGFNPKP